MIQSVLIPTKWNFQKAVNWLIKHNHNFAKLDITDNFYRFRQTAPKSYAKYRTKKLNNGVIYILEY